MRKRVTLLTVAALLLGLLAVALPGTALQIDDGSDGPLASQSQGQSLEEDPALAGTLLQVLADKLGISVDRLKDAINATKDEVIQQRLGEAVRAGRITPERARALQQRLSQAGPRELLHFMLGRSKAQRGLERSVPQPPSKEELKRGWLIGPQWQPPRSYMPPYYPPYYYPYNCVCYCSFPWSFAPTPMQPQSMTPPFWRFHQPQPRLKPEAPQNP